ncbi:MAG: hypothetical protein ACXWPV_09745, partial [Candidatus Limnocylindrales bacterium]
QERLDSWPSGATGMPSVADLVADHLLRSLTDAETYEAGRQLAAHGAVTFESFEPMRVRAAVDDGGPYLVELRSGPGKLGWSCSEPGGSRGDFCRHCVATAVETWQRAPARATGGAPPDMEAPGASAPTLPPPLEASPSATVTPAPPAGVEAALAMSGPMRGLVTGVHAIVFSPDAEAVRAFFRDVLGLPSVDAGGGWLIFALPPAELAVHPADADGQALYLICDDIAATVAELRRRGVAASPVHEEAWGLVSELALPGGTRLTLYQPTHVRPATSPPTR